MTTRDELDRVITHVGEEMTRADATGLGDRLRARLDRLDHTVRRPARAWGWQWTIGAAGAVAAVVLAVIWTPPGSPRVSSAPVNQVPPRAAVRSDARTIGRSDLSAVASAKAEDRPLQQIVAPPSAPRQVRAPRRSSRPVAQAMSAAELEWLARGLPALPEAADVSLSEVVMKDIEPRGLELPVLVIEPLGPRDIYK